MLRAFISSRRAAAVQPLVKRVVQSRVYRGLKQLPRRKDPRGLTLLVSAAGARASCDMLTCSMCAGMGHQIPTRGGARCWRRKSCRASLTLPTQGALAGAVALALATLLGLYKLINGGQARVRTAAAQAPRAKRD